MATLDNFVLSSKTLPKAVATSQEIRDRSSTFIGAIYRAASYTDTQAAIRQHAQVVHGANKASHKIAAWRVVALKYGRDGLRGPEDFEVASGSADDGEDGGGRRVLRTMETEGVLDAVVIVSRWYGGTLLGPIRFGHIETCAREVCRSFKVIEEVQSCIEELKELDERLVQLRGELAPVSPPEEPSSRGADASQAGPSRAPDYTTTLLSPPDLPRAKRLIVARRNAIKSVSIILARNKS